MAATESPKKLGIRPFDDFAEVDQVWPRGDRLDAIREAATGFRERFATPDNRIDAVQTVDLASAAYPTKFALAGAAKGLNPYINIINRLVIVQFEDFDGKLRTLAWEPTIAEGAAEAPFYDQLLQRYGEFLSYKVFATFSHTVAEAVAVCGLTPADIDYVSFDHLHVQDLRLTMGTTKPINGEPEPRRHSSRTRSSCSSARRSTPSGRSTRCSGPGTCRAAWTT